MGGQAGSAADAIPQFVVNIPTRVWRSLDNAPVDDLDFFADLMITGTVLGLDHTSEQAAVEEAFGHDHTFEAPSRSISNFGLVEFGWWRDRPQDKWAVTYFGAQTHRLPWLTGRDQIESVLIERYGMFRPRLDFAELLVAVQARGFGLVERPSVNGELVEYWEPTSTMGLLVVADPEEPEEPEEPPGTVLKMLGPGNPHVHLLFQGREQKFKGYADHLLTLREPELITWLDRREPGGEPGRTDWWTYLRSVVAHRRGGAATRDARWRRLGFVLDHHAAERGIDTADEAAITLICSLAKAREQGMTDGLPTMDEAVERWLAATTTIANATRLCTDRALGPSDVRLSRRLRNQIHIIQSHLPHIASPVLADELRAWIELKPLLLQLPIAKVE